MIALKYGKRKVVSYRGAKMVVGGLTSKNKIDVLLYMARELANLENQKELLERVVAVSREVFEVDNITVRLWQRDKLVPVSFLKQTDPPRRDLDSGEGYSGMAFEQRKSMILENLENYPDYVDPGESTKCAMVTPIMLRDQALGTIAIEKDIPHFYKKDDLEILDAMGYQLALSLNEVKLVEGLVDARSRIQSDLKMGRTVQSQIIPAEIPPWNSIRFGHYFEPMVEVSGDYFDVMRSGNNLTCIIADVSGHGVPAALVTMALHFQFRRCVEQGLGLTEMMEELNESMRHRLPDGTYFTAQLVRIYGDHSFSYVNAGHVKLLHYRQAINDFVLYDTKGIPLGITNVKRTDYEEKFSKLESGDHLLMLTDGFHEQRNASLEPTGGERLLQWLKEVISARDISDPAQLSQDFITRFDDFVAGAPREDDLTFLAISCSKFLQQARSCYDRARRAFREKELSFAESFGLESYRLDSSLHDNLFLLFRVYHTQERFADAARFLNEYIASSGASKPEYHHILGVLHYKSGEIRNAKREFKKSLSLDHTYAKASLMLARCYLKEGAPPKAVKTLQQALKSSPGNERVKLALGNVENLVTREVSDGSDLIQEREGAEF